MFTYPDALRSACMVAVFAAANFAAAADGLSEMQTQKLFDVTEFGARADGETLDTEAVQSAIDAAVDEGGGTVRFPAGVYLSSLLRVHGDHVTLFLEEGATLSATTDLDAYPANQRRLLHVDRASDVHLRGPGTIDLKGRHFTRERRLSWRILYFERSENVSVRDITIRRSPNWTLTFKNCDGVRVDGVRIEEGRLINSDGIGILSSRNVHISNCFIDTSDDAIVIKSRDPDRADVTKNVLIEDCVVASSSNGVKIGTETRSDFRNITIRNIEVRKPSDGRRERPLSAIAIMTDDGGHIENVRVENVRAEEVYAGFFIRVQRRLRGERERPGTIRNLVIDGLHVERQLVASSIMGIPDYEGAPAVVGPDIRLRNIRIRSVEPGTAEDAERYPDERPTNYPDGIHFAPYPAYGLYIRHAVGVVVEPTVEFKSKEPDPRPAVRVEETAEVEFVPD